MFVCLFKHVWHLLPPDVKGLTKKYTVQLEQSFQEWTKWSFGRELLKSFTWSIHECFIPVVFKICNAVVFCHQALDLLLPFFGQYPQKEFQASFRVNFSGVFSGQRVHCYLNSLLLYSTLIPDNSDSLLKLSFLVLWLYNFRTTHLK